MSEALPVELAPAVSNADELEFEGLAWPVRANVLAVTTDAEFAAAGELLTGIKALRARIAESCDPVIEAARRMHQAALAQRRTLEAPLVEAEATIKRKLAAFHEERERERRAEAARLEAEQRRQAEEARTAERAALEAAGNIEAVAEIDATPQLPLTVSPPALPAATKPAGVSMVTRWKAIVDDKVKLAAAVGRGEVPAHAIDVNMATVNAAARSMREAFNWPGVRAVRETGVAAKAKR